MISSAVVVGFKGRVWMMQRYPPSCGAPSVRVISWVKATQSWCKPHTWISSTQRLTRDSWSRAEESACTGFLICAYVREPAHPSHAHSQKLLQSSQPVTKVPFCNLSLCSVLHSRSDGPCFLPVPIRSSESDLTVWSSRLTPHSRRSGTRMPSNPP